MDSFNKINGIVQRFQWNGFIKTAICVLFFTMFGSLVRQF